jgi:cytochrome bd-type quinol oxidase subunit 2
MRSVIVIFLVAVLAALAGAGYFMLRRPQDGANRDPRAMARALALRVGLSVAVFLLILLAWSQGWIKPTGLPIH